MIQIPMRANKYEWAARGGEFEWALVLGSCPDRHEFEYLRSTLTFALDVIERGMIAAESRFSGFDGIEMLEGAKVK